MLPLRQPEVLRAGAVPAPVDHVPHVQRLRVDGPGRGRGEPQLAQLPGVRGAVPRGAEARAVRAGRVRARAHGRGAGAAGPAGGQGGLAAGSEGGEAQVGGLARLRRRDGSARPDLRRARYRVQNQGAEATGGFSCKWDVT